MAFVSWRLKLGPPAAWLGWNLLEPGASVSPRKGPECPSCCQAATSPGTISCPCFYGKLYLLTYLSCVIEKPKHFHKHLGLRNWISNLLTRCDSLFVAFVLWWRCAWTVVAIACKKLKKRKEFVRYVCKWFLRDNLPKKDQSSWNNWQICVCMLANVGTYPN